MPSIGFKCECGEVSFEQCLKDCPRGVRCLSRPTLVELAKQRVWSGKPSTTQLLNGTRYAMLEILEDYYIDPESQAFRLLGTKVHSRLEDSGSDNELVETRFEDDDMTGIADLYEIKEETLWDYKVLGSFKVAKTVGINFEMVDHPEGEVYQKSGNGYSKGDIKKVKRYFIDESLADRWEYTMQLNRYRIFYEQKGHPVKHIKIQAIVRDGGSMTAKSRGIEKSFYVIDIPIIPDEEVLGYYEHKEIALHNALQDRYYPKCNNRENWEGRKCCPEYCNVYDKCQEMGE